MKTAATDELNHIGDGFIRCAIGETLVEIPNEMVSSIDLAQSAAPLPLTYPMVEGIVLGDQGACLQLNLVGLNGAPYTQGKYAISLNTSKGLICLRTDSVAKQNGYKNLADFPKVIGINEIEEHIKEFRLTNSVQSKAAPSNQREQISRSLILCNSNGKIVGIDTKFVNRIERSFKSHMADTSISYEKIIELEDGSLHRGISLKQWLDSQDLTNQSAETWAIALKTDALDFVLITEQLINLSDFNEHDFFRIEQIDRESCWLSHPEYGPIEILDPYLLLKINSSNQSGLKNNLSTSKSNPALTLVDDLLNGVGIHFENYDLVIPSVCVDSVGEIVNVEHIQKKRAGKSMPAYDLSGFLQSQHQLKDKPQRLITLQDDRKRKFALLVPELYKPKSNKSWKCAHTLPYPLDVFIKGVRISDARGEFLIDENFINQLLKPEFEKEIKNSFCGWLPL
jgi:hypothetical protein